MKYEIFTIRYISINMLKLLQEMVNLSLAKRIFKYILPYKKKLTFGILSMLIHSFLTIFFIKIFKDLIETIIAELSTGQEGLTQLSWIALLMIIIYFFKGLVYYGQKYLIAYVAQKAVRDIRNELYQHLQSLSMSFYNKNKTGELISRVTNDVGILQGAIVNSTISLVYQFLTFIGGVGYLFYLNYRLTVFLIVVLPLMTYIITKFNKKIRKISKNVQIKIAGISDVLQETLSAIRVVKSFGREEYEFDRFSDENDANFKAHVRNARYQAALTPIIEFLAALVFTSILWYGGYEVMQGHMKPSELIAFFTLLLTISSPLRSLSRLSGTIQKALAAAERIFEVMDIDKIITTENSHTELVDTKGKVEFEDICFAYKSDEQVLKHINFCVNSGEVVALVGPSGAGKTTLADLIPRFYDPDTGKVLLDGKDIKEFTVESLRAHIGIVPQENILFEGTLRENILYGKLDATNEEIIKAAKAANAHNFIMKFDDGYDTMVGERGVGLSGGQRQRIAIARALLKDPAILILDEATSSLDAESESLVQDALASLMEDRTTFIIAHRLITIKNADRIFVLSAGEIIEEGTHKQLLKNGELYYNLYQNQAGEDDLWE